MIKINKIIFSIHKTFKTKTIGTDFQQKTFLINQQGGNMCFWNDIPYQNNGVFNTVIEIPRFTLAKMELKKEEKYHPIVQDTRKNPINKTQRELRYYAQFPPFHYGFIPQTWESKYEKYEDFYGDNDPIDIIEVGQKNFKLGEIVPVKVLGGLCLIDQGELDWKIITLNIQESEERGISCIEQIEQSQSGYLWMIKHWFQMIKTYDGKKQNKFYSDNVLDSKQSIVEIEKTHKYWQELQNDIKYEKERKLFEIEK